MDGLICIDEGLDGFDNPFLHLVNLIKDKQRLLAFAHVATDPVSKLIFVHLSFFLVWEIEGTNKAADELAVPAILKDTLGDELGNVVLANAWAAVETQYQWTFRAQVSVTFTPLDLLEMPPERVCNSLLDEVLPEDVGAEEGLELVDVILDVVLVAAFREPPAPKTVGRVCLTQNKYQCQ